MTPAREHQLNFRKVDFVNIDVDRRVDQMLTGTTIDVDWGTFMYPVTIGQPCFS